MRDARVRPDTDETDVLIVGAGPVGLTLALGLARQGARCRIVDRDAGPSPTSRASELHARTLEVLDAMGAAEDVLAAGLVLRVITFISRGRCVARISTAGIDSSFPARLAIPQSDTERILESHLAQAGVTVERERELLDFVDDSAGVTATFHDARGERTAIRAGWLVGCDGVHSAVRQHLGLAFDGEDYPGVWAIVDARIDGWACPPGEVFVFLGRDTMWSGALPNGCRRLYFRHDANTALPRAEEAQAVLERHAPGARIREVVNRGAFRIHRRMASRFRVGRVLLAGDAGHVCSPSAGVGMNAGMQDSANLAWKLGLVVAGRAPESLLESYEVERKAADGVALSLSHEAQTDMLVSDAVHDRALAVHLAKSTAQMLATEAGVELQIHYRESSIVAGVRDGMRAGAEAWPAGPAPGDRIADAGPLVPVAGQQRSLRDVLRGPHHTLLVLAGEADDESRRRYTGLITRTMDRLGATVRGYLVIIADGPPAEAGAAAIMADPTLSVHGRLGAAADTMYLVRPDGYLAFRSEPPDPVALDAYLGQVFLKP